MWNVELNDGETTFRGKLQVFGQPAAGNMYIGTLDLTYTYKGQMKQVRENANIEVTGNQVQVICSNPHFLRGSGSYDADNFYFTMSSPTQFSGRSSDTSRGGGSARMWASTEQAIVTPPSGR